MKLDREKVARWLYNRYGDEPQYGWDDESDGYKERFLADADDLIAALAGKAESA